ncbi:hypothetical protein ACFXJ8_21815 [Nonomuraea sp. NPDC059194]|uniref:hypothetical protein n=1 Tax=Nonomuraea sp. NPDC059194 TaxID=3346764 RepID=UPI0036763DEA
MTDIVDRLAGIDPGSRLDVLRRRRQDAREYAQRTYEALFVPSFELGGEAAPGGSPPTAPRPAGRAPVGRGVSEVGL